MTTIACESCGAILSNEAKRCPKCRYPTPKNQGRCRVCNTILAQSEHRYTAYSNRVYNGSSSSSSYIQHVPCTNCGEPEPLRLSAKAYLSSPGFLMIYAIFSITIIFMLWSILVSVVRPIFGDTAKAKTNNNFAAVSSRSTIDLRGKWKGTFYYPEGVRTQFTMNITSSPGSLSGNLSETDPKTNQPVNSTLSGSIDNNHNAIFTQHFKSPYPMATCHASYNISAKSMSGECAAGDQSAKFTAQLM